MPEWKQNDIGVIFHAGQYQGSGPRIAQARDSVLARRERLASGYELKGDFHYDLIHGLGLRREGEASEASQDQE